MLNDVNLIVENQGIQDREGRIIQYPSQNNVLEILKPISIMYLLLYGFIFNPNDFFKSRLVGQPLSMIGLMAREIRIILQCANNSQNHFICNSIFHDS